MIKCLISGQNLSKEQTISMKYIYISLFPLLNLREDYYFLYKMISE